MKTFSDDPTSFDIFDKELIAISPPIVMKTRHQQSRSSLFKTKFLIVCVFQTCLYKCIIATIVEEVKASKYVIATMQSKLKQLNDFKPCLTTATKPSCHIVPL